MPREWLIKGGAAKPVVSVAVKGTPQPGLEERKLKGGAAKPVMALVMLNEGDVITVYVVSDDVGGASMTPRDAQFLVTQQA